MGHIYYNGRFYESGEPLVTFCNRSFRYGDSLFETIHAANGAVQLFDSHYNRLLKSMKVLKMQMPDNFTPEGLEKDIHRLLIKNKLFKGARVTLKVFRNGAGFYIPGNNDISYMITAGKLETERYELNKNGLQAGVFRDILKPKNILSPLKSSNSLIYVMAGIYKNEQQLDDCIILNENNNVCECISSNIFLVKQGQIYTPSLEEGCVEGVMRECIVRIAVKRGFTVFDDCIIRFDELLDAEEVFITNAIKGIHWIKGIQNVRYYNKTSKELLHALNEAIF